MTNRVLITGGTGLVGSAIDIPDAIKVNSKDADLTSQNQVLNLFEKYSPTHVIHCAAKVGGLGANMKWGGDFFRDNILMNTLVIEEARLCQVERLVAFSSTCVFPDDVQYPLTPDKIHLGPPHSSNAPYAYAKRMAIVQMEAYRQQYGLNYTTVIPCNIYGPHDNFNLNQCHVIPALIRKCHDAIINDDWFRVWGSGNPLREFIFSEDVGELTKRVLFEYEGNDPLIFSTSEEISIGDVAHMIANIMGYKKDIIFQTDKPDGQLRKPSDNTPIRKLYPNFKFTPMEIGLEKSITWFMENKV